jgi:exosome complex component RRP40
MGATRRDKPNFQEGTLIFCRVLDADSSSGLARIKLSCISPICKKAWNSGEAFFGELQGGFLREFPIGFCRDLLQDSWILDQLGEKFQFNVNVGFNGRIWVKGRIADTIFIMQCLDRANSTGDREQVLQLINSI